MGGGSGGGLARGRCPGGGGNDLGSNGVDVLGPVRGILSGFEVGMVRGGGKVLGGVLDLMVSSSILP